MRRFAPFLLIAALAVGCSGTDAATPNAATEPSQSPTSTPTAASPSPSPSATPTVNPCLGEDVRGFVRQVEMLSLETPFDIETDAPSWADQLLRAERTASGETKTGITHARKTLRAYASATSGTITARNRARAVAQSAVSLVRTCGLDDIYTITIPKVAKPKPKPQPTHTQAPSTDTRYRTCAEANRAGHGPYHRGIDAEYHWYQDRDGDGTVCER